MHNSDTTAAAVTAQIQAINDGVLARVAERTEDLDRSNSSLLQSLIEGLGDPRGLVRLRFAETLGKIGKPAIPCLSAALATHSNVVVRRAAAKTLTLIADSSAVPALLHAFLKDEDTVVRSSAAGALAKTGAAAVPALLEILASPEQPEDIKGHAAWALAFMGSAAAEQLYPALNSDSVEVRCAVIGAIAPIAQAQSDEKSCGVLLSALTDPEPCIRAEAASAFGQIGYSPALPLLIGALQDPDLEVRKAVISSLGKQGTTAALEPLRAALQAPESVVQALAKLAIAQIHGRFKAV